MRGLLIIAILFCTVQPLLSQEGDGVVSFDLPIRNSLVFNRYAINPTFTFVRQQNKFINFSNKREYIQFDNAPETFLGSYSGRFAENIGAGLSAFQQNYGVLTTFGGLLNFAYNVKLTADNNLTFGLNAAAYKSGINTSNIVTNFEDPSLQNVPSNFLLTVNPGVNFGTEHLDIGVSINNLVLYNIETSTMIKEDPKQGIQAHVMHTGYFNGRGFFEKTKFSGLLMSEFRKDETIISGLASLIVPKGIWFQIGYSNYYGVSGGLGINVTKNIAIEYNVEKAIGEFVEFGPSHEVTLAYRFITKKKFKYNGDEKVSGLFTKKRTTPIVEATEEELAAIRERAADRRVQAELDKKAEEEAQAKAEADAKLAAEEKAKLEAQEKAKKEAEEREKAEARAKLLVEQKAKQEAAEQAKQLAEQKAREEAAAKAKILAEQKAQEEEQKAKEEAEARAKQLAEQKLKKAAEEKARIAAELKAKELAEEEARQLAEQKAKEEADAKAKQIEEQKAREEAAEQARQLAEERAQQLEEQKLKEAEEEKERALAEQRAKELADAKAKELAEAKAKEALITNPNDDLGKSLLELSKAAEDSKSQQNKLIEDFKDIIDIKDKDLKDLKEENDLSDQGIAVAPKPFKSVTAENNKLNAIKSDLENVINSRNEKLNELQSLLEERSKIKNTELDEVNLFYKKKIKRLTDEQLQAVKVREQLVSRLESIKIATEFEKRRRIKRAVYDSDNDRYAQDRAMLQNIKRTTKLTTTPFKTEDFDFGERQSDNIQILKNINNTDSGYYLIIAVHSDINRRNEFVTKVVASGRTDVDFFYDVNTSKYYIYYAKVESIQAANRIMETKGNRPYNENMSLVKIEN